LIRRRFAPPDVRCRVRDAGGDEFTWLLRCGGDEARMRREVEARGYELLSAEPYDFGEWLARAEREARKAVEIRQRGEACDFRPALWGELKQYLFDLFRGKCAYCEGKVLHVASGDVEHYRPKRKVSEDPAHPGYYWLAYDIGNLLPCCERCNRNRAKMNRFPVRDGAWAHCPEELERERPLLLHPYRDEPREHLEFLPSGARAGTAERTGLPLSIVRGLTEEGKTSVDVYNLNRGDLPSYRGEAQARLRQDLAAALLGGSTRNLLHRLASGEPEYSSALLAEAKAILDELALEFEEERRQEAVPSYR